MPKQATQSLKEQYKPNNQVFYIKKKVKAIVKGVNEKEDKIHISYTPRGSKVPFEKEVPSKDVTPWKSYAERKKSPYVKPIIHDNSKTNRKPNKLQIKVKYFTDIEKINKIPQGDWIDLRAAETVELKAGESKDIKLGVGMKLPNGYEAPVVPRSSTFKTWGIQQTNSYGIIDNSYSGNDDEWKFSAYATRDTVINKGDRICQFRIQKVMEPVEIIEVDNLDEVSRGGFGSTGSN